MDAKFLLLTSAVSTIGFGSAWIVTTPSPVPATPPPSYQKPAPVDAAGSSDSGQRRGDTIATDAADAFLKADARAHAAAMAYSEAPRRERSSTKRGASSVYYAGCNAVRAAGAAPLYAGQPGYRPEMDGDHDGIACEPHRY